MTSSAAADPAFDTGTPWEGGDGAAQILTRAHQLTKPLLRAAVDTLPAELRLPIGYHLGWWNAAGVAAVAESGKGLRPALVLASARAAGKRGIRNGRQGPCMPRPPSNWCTISRSSTTM